MDKKVQWNLAAAVWVLVIGLLFLGYMGIRGVRKVSAEKAEAPSGPVLAKNSCPVDKVEVALAADTPRAIFQGVEYVFCGHKDGEGRDHKTLFLMDPELYLTGKSGLLPAQGAPQGAPQSASPTAAGG